MFNWGTKIRTAGVVALVLCCFGARATTTGDSSRPTVATVLTSSTGGVITSTVGFNSGPTTAFQNDGGSRMLKQANALNLMYTFAEATKVNGYGICAGGAYFGSDRGPKEWKIYGSNDYAPAGKTGSTSESAADAAATWVELDARSDETGWTDNEYRYYRFANATKYTTYKIDITANNGNTYTQWKYMEYCYEADVTLTVAGYPCELGVVMPAFGTQEMPSSATTFTSFENYTNEEETVFLNCVGYKIYTKNASDAWVESSSGTQTSVTMDPMPEVDTKLEWQYQANYVVSVPESPFGTVTGAGTYAHGATVTMSATPVEGYRFVRWAGDVAPEQATTSTIQLTLAGPASVIPLFLPVGVDSFVVYVAPDGDDANGGLTEETPKQTIASAVAYIEQFGDLGGTVSVARGTYEISEPIVLYQAIAVEGATGVPGDVVVTNKVNASWQSQDHRVFQLKHAAARVSSVTITGGSTNQKEGSGVYLEKGGTVTNCVIENCHASNYYGYGAGFAAPTGLVTHCIIRSCTHDNYGVGSGVACYVGDGARFENSLVTDVWVRFDDVSVFVANGGRIVNCTIVNQQLAGEASRGLGLGWSGVATNCVVAGCVTTNGTSVTRPISWWVKDAESRVQNIVNCAVDYIAESDAAYLTNRATLIKASDFKDYANGDYRPKSGGALVDKGVTPEGWMSMTDLAGKPRVNRYIDIGCYEGMSSGLKLIVR